MMKMPISRVGDPSDPFVQYHGSADNMKEDLESLFGGEEDEIFNGVDFSTLDLDDVDLSVFESSSYDSDSDGECVTSKFREIRNHDCMWGGQCCNKEYQFPRVGGPAPPVAKIHAPAPPPVPVHVPQPQPVVKLVSIQKCAVAGDRTDIVVVTDKVNKAPKSEPSRSLLLNRTIPPQPPRLPKTLCVSPVKTPVKREPQTSRPETPQSLSGSDDDLVPIPIDSHNTTSIFRSALDALSAPASGDWEADLLSFSEVKRTKDEKKFAPSQTDILRLSASAKSDHNYLGSSKSVCLEGLGVETPSDSDEDEEIDVVSLSERSSSSRSSSCGRLPTRPTARDQEHLEEITTSLLSASEAVSRKLKRTVTTQVRHKRKYQSESSDDDDDDDDDDDEEDCEFPSPQAKTLYQRQIKRQKPVTPKRKKQSRFGEEEDSQEKRDLHNNMERMRRIDLRNSFEELKALVPGLANKERAAKVVILREAANYCCELGAESQSKCMQVTALRKEQERLRAMVSSLRKAAATVRTPRRC